MNLSLTRFKLIYVENRFVGLALVGKDIVLRFIREHCSLRDFGSEVIGLLSYEDF